MELLSLILLLGLFALWVSNRGLKQRLDTLEQRLDEGGLRIERAPAPAAERAPPAAQVPFTVGYTKVPEPAPAAPLAAEPLSEPEREDEPETIGGLFERLLAGRLLIWLGGVALVVGAVYLIRYSIEIGLVTPTLRMLAAAVLGFVLLGLGEYARAGRWRDDPRFAQVFVGAGLAVLYLTTYGSHVLHGLIGPGTASALMLAVTAAALVLSLRHGAPAAVMGLTGGFLT